MIVDFKVYRKEGDRMPVISPSGLPNYQFGSRLRFVGKRAKIEAIFRFNGERLPEESKRQDVESYIADNIFKTPKWGEYYKHFKEVASERETISSKIEYQYVLRVELIEDIDLSLVEEEVIYFIINELIGEPKTEYKNMKNPILKLSKHY